MFNFQAIHPWVKDLNVNTSVQEKFQPSNISVVFLDIELQHCNWTISNLNLLIIGSDLRATGIFLRQDEGEGTVFITNSTFGHLNVSPGYRISVTFCNMDDANRLQTTLLDIIDCRLSILKCVFHNTPDLTLLHAVRSQIAIEDVKIIVGTTSYNLVEIADGSELELTHSTIIANKSTAFFHSQLSVVIPNLNVRL